MKKITSKIFILTIIIIYILKNSPVVRAETIVFEDDFSNGFGKWESVRNNFDMWSIIDEQADVFIDQDSTLAELVPKDSFWNSEWKNIIYELDYKYVKGVDKNISWGFQDVKNWYEIHFVGGSFFLSHVKNGQVVWDHTGHATPLSGVFSHIKIEINEGLIIFSINGNEIINVTDPTFDNDYGKIGLKGGAGSIYPTHAIYDNIVVKSLDNLINKLKIVPQKQTDSAWASEEYDSADDWSDNINDIGIGNWGCLITSISMIMNFHGIDKMPGGEAINPSSINSWLQSQPDGYLRSGLVNWLAITRLTNLINDQYSTPKFEYQRVAGNDFDTAKDQINSRKPVVLQIPGHFLVGNGIVDTENDQAEDLYITDPSYNYEKFSQHQEDLESTRILTPTFTDLSYLHVSHDPNVNLKIVKADGTEVVGLQSFEEYLDGFIADENLASGGYSKNTSPAVTINEIEKPEAGTYIIEFSQENFGPIELEIFAYNKNGDLSNLSYSGLVGKNKVQFKIFYDNENNSTIERIINFNTLKNDIGELSELGEIKKHYVATELEKYSEFGKTSSSENYLRYVDALQQLVEWYSPKITEVGKTYLNQRLLEIKNSR